MRREKTGKLKEKLLLGMFTLVLVATFGLSGVFVSYADGQAKVTARSAKIRKEASTSSDVVGGVKSGDVLNVISTVKGADGKDWYQITFNNVSGYIRSDLASLTEGSAPSGGGGENNGTVDVRPLDPVNATVTRDSGRVRSNPSVSSTIISEVPNGLVLTVTGDVTDADGSVWYQVNYSSGDGTQVNGYIRSDYVTLSSDANPPTDTPPESQEPTQDPAPQDKPYDVILYEGDWHLLDTATNNAYKIETLFTSVDAANSNAALYEELAKSEKSQKIIIIVLIFLLVAAVAGIAFLVFKIKDMMDAAYFSEVENDALRKRKAANQGGQRATHSVGAEGQQGRTTGARQAGASQGQRMQGSGQRASGSTQGQRTSGGMSQGQRVQGTGQGQRLTGSSQGQRASGGMSQGQRMQGSGQEQRMQGQRPQGAGQDYRRQDGNRAQGMDQDYRMQDRSQRAQGTDQDYRMQGQRAQGAGQDYRRQDSGQRMQGTGQDYRRQDGSQRMSGSYQDERQEQGQRGSGVRPMGAPQGARPMQSQDGAQRAQRRNEDQGWQAQAKNFMAEEEEEFDLEFLNYDEEQ